MEMTSSSRELVTAPCATAEKVPGDLELLTPCDSPSLNTGACGHASISGKTRKKNLNQQHVPP